ncbi:outer membrane protein OmpA-like peptidoglycan-associated protein [Flavobacterium sp. 28A]|uniref:OmpA family protein n=1 Tax=Flavobacterium sp. 28A TaxID=2735895 RepID=UPI00156DB05F|nr:OmpA family protein [Flavobacterium sp. 28A]NRT16864.1 outer membrane protein OmpA-like peptidoglycan-associated protein [Flavobacterium sp. 28A]
MAFNLNKSEDSKSKFDLSKNNIDIPAVTNTDPIVENPEKSKKWIFLLAGLILVGVASSYFFLDSKEVNNNENETKSVSIIKSNDNEEELSNIVSEVKDSSKVANKSLSRSDDYSNINSKVKSPSNDVKTDNAASNESAVAGTNSENGKSSNDLPYKNGEFYNIYQFPFGAANFTSSNVELDNLVNVLKNNSELKISIIAYTDNVGGTNVNQQLSVKRAKAIFNYIVSKGIIAERLSYEGKGISTKYPTQGENRRAEFILKG